MAERILNGMKDCRFFKVNPKNGKVFVSTFKSSELRTFGRRKKKYQSPSDFCKKLDVKKYTLREMKKVLRELLIEEEVKKRQPQQVQRLGNLSSCVTEARKYAITLKHFSDVFGLSKSSAHRYLARMEEDGRVSKTLTVAECVIPHLNERTAAEWIERNPKGFFHARHGRHGWSGWRHYGNIYEIVDRRVSDSFKHVIWNHKYRRSAKVESLDNRPDGEGFWSKHS